MPTTHYSGDGRTPRTNTILHPDEVYDANGEELNHGN